MTLAHPLNEGTGEDRGDNWIQTFTGKAFYPFDPRPEDICIEDIAHALSNQCRYAGHTHKFYSVAEHSVLLSYAVHPQFARWALLHDSSEAYLTDIPRPIKHLLPQYKEAEARVMKCIVERFGLDPLEEPEQVREYDTRILHNERDALLGRPPRSWGLVGEPLTRLSIEGWSPVKAEGMFLEQYAAILEHDKWYAQHGGYNSSAIQILIELLKEGHNV